MDAVKELDSRELRGKAIAQLEGQIDRFGVASIRSSLNQAMVRILFVPVKKDGLAPAPIIYTVRSSASIFGLANSASLFARKLRLM